MNVAILFRGGISKKVGGSAFQGDLEKKDQLVNYICAYNSFKKHILTPNSHHNVDIFIHSWHKELEQDLSTLYKPKKMILEDNKIYHEEINEKIKVLNLDPIRFGVISQNLSQKKVANIAIDYSIKNNIHYDLILIYRLDILLLKDLIFDNYDLDNIYCNRWVKCRGEFHFVMNFYNLIEFSKLYDYFSSYLKPIPHTYYHKYVKFCLEKNYLEDDIITGYDEELVRKAYNFIKNKSCTYEDLAQYGITKEEIESYD